jgi:hypothetical protein
MGYERDVNIGFPRPEVQEWQKNVVTKRSVSANGAGDNVSLFKVVGSVKVLSIVGKFIDVTDVSAVTVAYLDLYDDSAHVITKATGTTLSGVVVGAIITRTAAATTALTLVAGSDGSVTDGNAVAEGLSGFLAQAQTGTATYIRFNFTSDTGGYDFTIAWEIVWMPLVEGSYIEGA